MDILPIYMVQNYNIYGTAHPYYPSYVPGYGYVREMPPPALNPERTVDYYGYDITSPAISNHTIYDRSFTSDTENNRKYLSNIENTSVNFFSLYLSRTDPFNSEDGEELVKLMDKLYSEKSLYEE